MSRRGRLVGRLALLVLAGPAAPSRHAVGDDFTFERSAGGVSLADVVERACEATGEPFFFECAELKTRRVHLTGRIIVPRAQILSFLDACLAEAGVVHLERTVAGIRLHALDLLGPLGVHGDLKTQAECVAPAELPGLAGRRTLISTAIRCRSVGVASGLANGGICLYFGDSAVESVRRIEGTNVIVMTGYAQNVAKFAALADRVSATARPDEATWELREIEARIAALETAVAELRRSGAGR